MYSLSYDNLKRPVKDNNSPKKGSIEKDFDGSLYLGDFVW